MASRASGLVMYAHGMSADAGHGKLSVAKVVRHGLLALDNSHSAS